MQERFGALEAQARVRISRALTESNARLEELDRALGRVSRDDWSVPGLRRHVEALRARAENLRTAAIKRAADMPGEAVSALASGSRAPIRGLANRLAEMARRIEPEKKGEAGKTRPQAVPKAEVA